MTPRAICVIGNANLDLVMGPLESWPERGTEMFLPKCDFRIGGSAANTALALRHLGVESGLVAGCGTDPAGALIAQAFTSPLDRVLRYPAPTGISVGVLFPDAERSFLSSLGHLSFIDLTGISSALADWPLEGALVLVSGAFALPSLLLEHTVLLDHLRSAGAEIAIDPGWPNAGWTDQVRAQMLEWIARAHHVLINDKELEGLTFKPSQAEGLAWLADYSTDTTTFVAKSGKAGCFARRSNRTVHVPARKCVVFDTVGAGDAFNAGYLAATSRGEDYLAAIQAGNETAVSIISHFPRQLRHV